MCGEYTNAQEMPVSIAQVFWETTSQIGTIGLNCISPGNFVTVIKLMKLLFC